MDTRNCTDLELGLKVQDRSKFYPTHEVSKRFLDLYEDKLLCLKEDDLIISGSWGNGRARQLNFQIRRCLGQSCKSDAEIRKFFAQKYLIMLSNEVRFVPDGFGDNRTSEESIITWLPIST